jgi:hypothetical protein
MWPANELLETLNWLAFLSDLPTHRTLEQAIQGDIPFKVRDISLPTGLSRKLAPLRAAKKEKSTDNPAAWPFAP